MYVVDRDFGFAPNPFHGRCTLATCKPAIRERATIGDWVVGMGGARLKAIGRCVYAMRVTDILSFDQYWADPRFRDKRPVRRGSSKMLVGDNIYSRAAASGEWQQADSHHSNPDGSPNIHNLEHDTKVDRVLVSEHYFYFGKRARKVPSRILNKMGYSNVRNYRVFTEAAVPLIEWLETRHGKALNLVIGDPFDFERSTSRYSTQDNRIRNA